MSAVLHHWTFDPTMLLLLAIVLIHVRGLRRHLRAIKHSGRSTRPWIGQALIWWAGIAVVFLAVASPLDYATDKYLTAHVIQHILLSFVAPPLIVIGAPWVPLLMGLPIVVERAYARLLQRTRASRIPATSWGWSAARSVRAFAARPWTPVVAFNATMVFWHLPGPFDLAASNEAVHIWLAHGLLLGLGVGMWLQVFGSYPFRPVLAIGRRILVLVSTNAVMVLVAMTMVMFTRDLYPWYAGLGLAAQASDQQIAGAILWVCGEVTFLPSILYLVTRGLDEESSSPRRTDLAVTAH